MEGCANSLARRGAWDFLAEKGSNLSPKSQIIILRALANGGFPDAGTSRNKHSQLETGFWTNCAAKYPCETVSGLHYIGLSSPGYHRFNMVLHDPLRDFLVKEADLATKNPETVANEEHGYPVAEVVQFVGTWKRFYGKMTSKNRRVIRSDAGRENQTVREIL